MTRYRLPLSPLSARRIAPLGAHECGRACRGGDRRRGACRRIGDGDDDARRGDACRVLRHRFRRAAQRQSAHFADRGVSDSRARRARHGAFRALAAAAKRRSPRSTRSRPTRCAADGFRSATASSSSPRRSSPTAQALRWGSRRAMRRSARRSARASASRLKLRRADQRMLLGCGAAGAIAAAFGAPLTGAFYAFELIIGAYSLANAAPVIAAAVAGALAVKTLGGAPYLVSAPTVAPLGLAQHIALVGLGLISAAIGVGAMRAAAGFERLFRLSRLPIWARPVARRIYRRRVRLLHPASARRRPRRAPPRHPARAGLGDARHTDKPENYCMPDFAGERVSRRTVLRLDLHRGAGRQALRAGDRRRGAVVRARPDRLLVRRHGARSASPSSADR